MTGPHVPRRAMLLWGGVGLTTGCSVRLASSAPPTAQPTPDDDARNALAWTTTGLTADCRTLARDPRTTATARRALGQAATAFAAQAKALGPPSSELGTPSHPVPVVTRMSPRARVGAADALARVPDVSGPMARLLTRIGAGMLVQSSALARASGQPGPAVPRVAGTGTPALSDPAFLALVRTGGNDRLFTSPPDANVVAALRALSVALRKAEYGYGLISARFAVAQRGPALARGALHRRAALSLDALGQSAGLTLPPAAAAYPVGPVATQAAARTLAGRLELACADAAGRLVVVVPQDSPRVRAVVADHLVTSALGAAGWGARPPLPGG